MSLSPPPHRTLPLLKGGVPGQSGDSADDGCGGVDLPAHSSSRTVLLPLGA